MPTMKETKVLSGEWVLLFEDEIIDHSANIEDMLILAAEQFPQDKVSPDKIRIAKVFHGTPREKLLDK